MQFRAKDVSVCMRFGKASRHGLEYFGWGLINWNHSLSWCL